MAEKAELIITALQQRIGEIVSNYETQIAILRADYTNVLEQLNNQKKEEGDKQQAIDEYSQKLEDIVN